MARKVNPEPGFYYLTSKDEPEPVLVHGYHCSDMNGEFVFGLNTHDGGGLLPLSDLTEDTKVAPVAIMLDKRSRKESFNAELDVAIHRIFEVIDTYYDKRVAAEIKAIVLDLIDKRFG